MHAERARTGRTDWAAIATFYDQLTRLAPSIGAAVARAAAHAEVHGAQAGLALLDQIDAHSVVSYQPYWAVRADLLRQLPARMRPPRPSTARSVSPTMTRPAPSFSNAADVEPSSGSIIGALTAAAAMSRASLF